MFKYKTSNYSIKIDFIDKDGKISLLKGYNIHKYIKCQFKSHI